MLSFRKSFLPILLVALMSACSSSEKKNSEDPKVVYDEGVRLLEKESFLEATDFFNEIKKRFPQSRYNALADLRLADLYFAQEEYSEAAAAYGAFFDLYPSHNDASYALFKKAQSHYKNVPENIARDQAPAQKAVESSRAFLDRFPQSSYSKEAEEIYDNSRLRLAEKEAYIARYYERKDAFPASLSRWKNLVEEFKDLQELPNAKALFEESNKAIPRLTELSAKQREKDPNQYLP